ncbi:MAG: TSUP family transporter [Verrucomicrobia bacterium]|nr:TSUP family transporter [Verrucomicrobiota bacterium]
MPEPLTIACLCAFALLAGFVDAVVGGGGLIQIPALFLFLPPAEAARTAAVLGTNKLSSICGTGMAVVQYARRVPLPWRSLLPAALVALVCSFLGARVVTLLNPALVRPLILGLLVAVAVYTYVRKDFGHRHAPRFPAGRERLFGMLTGAGIGFYDGFFGPGTGSFLIFAFIGGFGFDFLSASASAKVINFATNLSAVAYFAATDHLLYRYGLPMAACNMLGSMLGARLALGKGNRFVRGFFLVVVAAMIVRFGWEVLGR